MNANNFSEDNLRIISWYKMQAKLNHWDSAFVEELMNILDKAERPPEDIIQFSNMSTATHGDPKMEKESFTNMTHHD